MLIFVEMFGKFLKFIRKGNLERFVEGEKLATRDKRTPLERFQAALRLKQNNSN